MRRESLKLQESDWRRLDQLAAATGSLYSGQPSWRRLILRIARGEVTIRATKRVVRRANTMNTIDINKIAGRIRLVIHSAGMFRARKVHRRETAEENKRHGLSKEAVVSVCISNHPALDKLAALHNAAYLRHKELTLPSCQDGIRVLPAGKEMDYRSEMAKFKLEHEALAKEFLRDYEDERDTAPARLNGLYDADMWPDIGRVFSQFKFEIRYLPCPTDGEWSEWIQESAQAGNAELRDRLVEAAQSLAGSMADGRVYQKAIDKLQGICDMVASDFNLLDDPTIRQAAQGIQAELAGTNSETYKGSDNPIRQEKATKLERLLQGLGGIR